MKKAFIPLLVVATAMFAYAPIFIANAPYESTMLLIQKVMYFHAPSGMVMLMSGLIAGLASAVFLFRKNRTADHVALAAAELTAVYGVIVLLSGPLWLVSRVGYAPGLERTVKDPEDTDGSRVVADPGQSRHDDVQRHRGDERGAGVGERPPEDGGEGNQGSDQHDAAPVAQ